MSWHHGPWRGRPPWWPDNEQWPPVNRRQMWRHGRARFVRRAALALAVVLFLSALGLASLVSMLFGARETGGFAVGVSPVLVAVATGVALVALLFLGVRRVGLPLGNIVEAANRVADGDYSARVPDHGPRPVRTVGHAFNTMAARLEAQDQQRRHLMADIAHELRTPLSVIQGRLEGLLDGVYARDDERLGEVLDEARVLSRLVDDLRTLANAESGMLTLHKEPTDLIVLLQELVSSFSREAGTAVAMRLDASSDIPLVFVDPLRIREVMANVISNALRHTPTGGTVSTTAAVRDGRVIVSVTDTGSGIAAEELPKIFDRFYKGATSRGSGLGLTIARNLVTAHDGEIRAESRLGSGTMITVALPLA